MLRIASADLHLPPSRICTPCSADLQVDARQICCPLTRAPAHSSPLRNGAEGAAHRLSGDRRGESTRPPFDAQLKLVRPEVRHAQLKSTRMLGRHVHDGHAALVFATHHGSHRRASSSRVARTILYAFDARARVPPP